ncbi:uncharacterized protein LOC120214969 [Hibiscus syriacus]|uniref:uncharacterized protein LOC120214969 n=1 Tax=Hibiscus syriacus TaxID=106335 RepID=UPI0019233C5F|nr:uncharacterized protein LOC120214969 [Hibiscus syriacus]XP_039068696.1 uncharacterized protein LOC120214969 [Hibiscus syriacus]
MDSNFYNESNKLNVLKSSNIPKLATTPERSRGNYYSSPENLIKYLRSNSVSSTGHSGSSGKSCFRSSVSPQSEKTPLKVVDEDVFVMDGVLVASDTNIIGSGLHLREVLVSISQKFAGLGRNLAIADMDPGVSWNMERKTYPHLFLIQDQI